LIALVVLIGMVVRSGRSPTAGLVLRRSYPFVAMAHKNDFAP